MCSEAENQCVLVTLALEAAEAALFLVATLWSKNTKKNCLARGENNGLLITKLAVYIGFN
jgi:hypothetical protein